MPKTTIPHIKNFDKCFRKNWVFVCYCGNRFVNMIVCFFFTFQIVL